MDVLLIGGQFENFFPCYLVTDGALVIQGAGRSISRLLPGLRAGDRLDRWFVVDRPVATPDPAALVRDQTAVQIRSIDGRLHLSGCVVEQPFGFVFCLSHSPGQAAAWGELGLTVTDFSIADQSLAVGTAISLQNTLMAELQETIENLQRARDEATAASLAKSTFLSVMSHEIRTPLNGILGMTQVMIRSTSDEQTLSRLDIVQQSGEGLLAILNDLLDLSRIEAGKIELESIPFDVSELLGGAHAAFTALANKKGLSMRLDIEGVQGRYIGDPTRIRQIVYNLLSNALKFTESGSVEMRAYAIEGGLEIEVADTGIGIAPEKLSEIFREFNQADTSINRRFGGTGLGLSIARDLAALMGGAITVESRVGEGSRFTVRLQVVCTGDPEPVTEPVEDAQTATLSLGSLRVLAAEDNDVNQLVLRTILEQFGVTATVVKNGREAADAWARQPWDVILMDIQMPVMGGVEATRLIRMQEAETLRKATPILALTANTMTHQLPEYEAAGFSGLIAKPIQVGLLMQALIDIVEAPEADRRE
jgi:signal transduction histidine kinase/CheY-like chemotaxis protein